MESERKNKKRKRDEKHDWKKEREEGEKEKEREKEREREYFEILALRMRPIKKAYFQSQISKIIDNKLHKQVPV